MNLQPHQQRVVDEKSQLDEKLLKLGEFFETPIYAALDQAEKDRLSAQFWAMNAYSHILKTRINAFVSEDDIVKGDSDVPS